MRGEITNAFLLAGRGTVITVRLTEGTVQPGDSIVCPLKDGETRSLCVDAIELIDHHSPSQTELGLVVQGIEPGDIAIGDDIRNFDER